MTECDRPVLLIDGEELVGAGSELLRKVRGDIGVRTPLATVALLGGCQSVEQKATYELRVTEAVVEAEVVDVLVANGQPVEFGQSLFVIS